MTTYEEMLSARAIALADASLVRQIVARTARAANLQQQLDALRDAVLRIPQGLSDNVPDALDYFANDLGGWAHQWAEGVRQQATAIRAALELSAPAEGEAGKPAEAEADGSKAEIARLQAELDNARVSVALAVKEVWSIQAEFSTLKDQIDMLNQESATRAGADTEMIRVLTAERDEAVKAANRTMSAEFDRDAAIKERDETRRVNRGLLEDYANVQVALNSASARADKAEAALKAECERLTNILRLDYGWDTPDEN